jgi:KaiC/GvpD/RAD55 family RecA-like ATPase
MSEEESGETDLTCPICGHVSPQGSTRCENCYSSLQLGSGPKDEKEGNGEEVPSSDKEIQELIKLPGIGAAKAEVLHSAGFRSLKDLQGASVEELSAVKGIGEKLAAKIIHSVNDIANPGDASLADWLSGEEAGLSQWLSGEERPQPAAAITASKREVSSEDNLAKWLSGKEDDVNTWLEEAKTVEAPSQDIGPNELLAREAELIQLRETLREKLQQIDTGDFDPQATIDELARIKGEFDAAKTKTKHLEEELENVKRGSIAVIKFIKSQQGTDGERASVTDRLAAEMANRETLELKIMQLEEVLTTLKQKLEKGVSELPEEAQDLKKQELALAERQSELEALRKQLLSKEEALSKGVFAEAMQQQGNLAQLQSSEEFTKKELAYAEQIHELERQLEDAQLELKHKEEAMKLTTGVSSSRTVDREISKKLEDAQRFERTLVLREQEVQKLKDELRIREEDANRLVEPMKYKEDEMLRREEDLMFRERLLQEEQKKVAQTKAELTGQDELTLKKRLEELQSEVTAKEEEVRNKEKYLSAKEEELRMREHGVITDEIEKREQDRMLELKQEKVKTGTTRLDDLLMGGFPFGSNVLVYGPPFTGKEVLLNAFIADGLKKGVPAIWITTEKSPREIREEMTYVVSGYEEYEKLGLVRYVDAYSRSMGDESQDPLAEYIESPTDYESIQKAVETAAKGFKDKHKYYRVGFRSISTLIAYLDPATAFRFLSPVVGRRKRDGAVALYTIEKGVHGEQEIQMIGALMDGMIEFKVENLNTFLAIRGICDVQSRAYIRYSSTKVGVTIGSFSLDHIR